MSDYDVVDTATADDGTCFRARLVHDDDAMDCNPRDNDVFGKIVHQREKDYNVPQEGELADQIAEAVTEHDFPVVARWLRVFHNAAVVLPIGYRALHAGTSKDTDTVGNYSGVTYATRDEVAAEFAGNVDEAETSLAVQVSVYGDWADGNVFGILVEKGNEEEGEWDTDNPEEAIWGFIGDDYAKEEARRMLEEAVSLYELRS